MGFRSVLWVVSWLRVELPTTSLTAEEVVMVLCWMTCCCEHAGWDLQEGYSLDLGKSTQTHQYSSFLGWARRLLKNVARGLLEIESVSCIFSGRLISKLSTVGHKAMPSQFTVTNKAMPSRSATWLDVFESRPVKSLSCLFKDPYVYQMWKNTHMWWENLCCSI